MKRETEDNVKTHDYFVTLVLAVFIFLQGCVTVPEYSTTPLPSEIRPYFKPCTPSEGAHALQVSESDRLIGNAELQWLAPSDKKWEIEVTSNFGQRLGYLAFNPQGKGAANTKIHQESRLGKSLPQMGLDSNGYLLIDEHVLLLKNEELFCVLRGVIPAEWSQRARAQMFTKDGIQIHFKDPDRELSVSLSPSHKHSASKSQICGLITWKTWFFWQQEISWCSIRQQKVSPQGPHEDKLKSPKSPFQTLIAIDLIYRGQKNYRLKLIPLDETLKTALNN